MVHGRRTDWLDGYTISSPCDPNGSGELKMHALGQANFRPENKQIALYSNGIGIASSALTYQIRQTRSLPVQLFCNMMADKMVQNHIILITKNNVLHTFQKVK